MVDESVKGRRQYDATGRRERAAASRRAVLAAAHRLLLIDGYAATTVPDVAAAAGVSAEFVYKNIGRKAALLGAVLDVALAGDDAPLAMAERESIAALRALTDPAEVLAGYLVVMVGVQVRVAPLLLLAARSADPDAGALVVKADTERLAGMTGLARHLHGLGGLRPGLDVDTAVDLLWAYTAPSLYDLLVLRRGWSPSAYREHVRAALTAALLG
ncbi:TetR family transcriptional regulator [Nakamurella flavida]|uniref:TetR family transcriptional regulator n=1 Tax=Nakamurella flavida TaxID=363630 RepID=A0A938YMI2_9ACTN|nr:TetR/AcrR family transcriptional regulator [Nakamurella flavida]MBM9475630.1 TetR family transcriptional regulator [Nakamurella flavida]MDP9778094.1 AcrR family transcriptional regulator [Nakamurella flavida]